MERDIMGDSSLPPEVLWGDTPPPAWHFDLRASFVELCAEFHQVMLHTAENYPYNTVPALNRFYKAFKAQDKSLEEFYKSFEAQIYEDSLCCIGISLQLKRNMLEKLGFKYPFLEKHLYFCTGNRYDFTTWPERYADQPPNHTGPMKDHALMVFKFTLENDRAGFVLFDLGFYFVFPIVVMKDGLSPDTGSFTARSISGIQTVNFQFHNEQFIHWLDTRSRSKGGKSGIEVTHRYCFVGKPLINPRQLERRDKVHLYHALVFLNSTGPEAGCYTILGKNNHFTMFRMEPNHKDMKLMQVSLDHFDQNDQDEDAEIQHILELISKRFGKSISETKCYMKEWSIIARDKEYLKQVTAIHDNMVAELEK